VKKLRAIVAFGLMSLVIAGQVLASTLDQSSPVGAITYNAHYCPVTEIPLVRASARVDKGQRRNKGLVWQGKGHLVHRGEVTSTGRRVRDGVYAFIPQPGLVE
jgi:hypothetical protein